MNHLPLRLGSLAGLSVVLLLSACAAPQAQAPQAQASDASQRKPEKRLLTGSRIPANDSTQIVRSISGSSADETLRNQPNPGRPGN